MPKTRAEPGGRYSSGMRFSAQFPWNLPEMLGRRASLTHDSARPIIPEAVEMTGGARWESGRRRMRTLT